MDNRLDRLEREVKELKKLVAVLWADKKRKEEK